MSQKALSQKVPFLLVAFLMIGSITFGAWDLGITQPLDPNLTFYPGMLVADPEAPAFLLSNNSTATATNVTITGTTPLVPNPEYPDPEDPQVLPFTPRFGCLTTQDVTTMGVDSTNFTIVATIDFGANHWTELGLSACVTGSFDSVDGYALGFNPYNGSLSLEKVVDNGTVDLGDTSERIESYTTPTAGSTLPTYNIKLVVDGDQIDGYLYDDAGAELVHVGATDTDPLSGNGAGVYLWKPTDSYDGSFGGFDANSVTPQGDWLDCRINTTPVAGDANRDGKVDGSDVTILANNWQKGVTGSDEATWEMGDFNGDEKVDGSDVTILANNWQEGVQAVGVAVPEPGTFALLLLLFGAGFIAKQSKKQRS